ncbi:MAG: FAD-dependent oxidoreductase [Succinivibrio sp.]|nr:FAD-dependent oxidoreductase [Succinivibrio sp.]
MYSKIIIGGGYFGLYLSWYLASKGYKVVLFEKESALMTHASYNNQARIHNGYHYPRSVLTALRSRVSFPLFIKDFPDCVYSSFDKYYCIGRHLSKVSSNQFYKFCKRIGAEIEPAPYKFTKFVNPLFIEDSFTVKEYAFDSTKLRDQLLSRIDGLPVEIKLNSEVKKVESYNSKLIVGYSASNSNEDSQLEYLETDQVFNCTYSSINKVNTENGIDIIPLKHEMTEMCLVDVPEEIKNLGITVMCGPFFSVMPFPSVTHNGTVVHSLSHVRYTPHYEWYDNVPYTDPHEKLSYDSKNTAFDLMLKDASRYIPILSECKYLRSLWEVKTVLPRSETDDSRPILCNFNHGLKGYHCIMGGKIDNVYDAVAAIENDLGL